MTKGEFSILLNKIQEEEQKVRADGQVEYAHDDLNAFANFERLATELGISRETVLWVYLKKHLDGILSWIKGNRSQRESVQGRIKDARMYLALLCGMADEDEEKKDREIASPAICPRCGSTNLSEYTTFRVVCNICLRTCYKREAIFAGRIAERSGLDGMIANRWFYGSLNKS